MTYLARQVGSFHRITHDEIEAERLVKSLDTAERRLLAGLSRGRSLRDVAAELDVSEPQALAIKTGILRKFGMTMTAELVRVGICAGLG